VWLYDDGIHVSEQHPQKQGLKLFVPPGEFEGKSYVSEQHPQKQGLKPAGFAALIAGILSQSNIPKNKD